MGEVRLNHAEINRLLYGSTGPVVREVTRVARLTQRDARRLAPRDTGVLKASIRVTVTAEPARERVRARIGSTLDYALYQEEGTGIYGPRGTPIRPKRAKYLRFKPKGARGFVFAKQVRGSRAHHYLVRALQRSSPWPVRRLR
ncbi:HK97 gp10 family phage protein [Streptomyces sp. LHD-70]|uniref:HK97 gp10 family phage protein n=1 Tax=Streptomyces sp. LHD-70 TaxID=3072140 RepID=UPI00280EA1C5|nr:HK97 gp10 family phage protein [Streptomyces sp. LHD-70]MDQ8708202.1 HK97 gp10 family phage protein [Streptomyces sp. LHD-70]